MLLQLFYLCVKLVLASKSGSLGPSQLVLLLQLLVPGNYAVPASTSTVYWLHTCVHDTDGSSASRVVEQSWRPPGGADCQTSLPLNERSSGSCTRP
jgi:hypothetical protein